MKILDMQQGGTEWHMARAGKVTASEIDSLVSPTLEIRKGQGPQTYLYKKTAELIMGYQDESGGTMAMDAGRTLETIALPWYEFQFGVTVNRVGFVQSDDGKIGCSPDGMIEGKQCGLEIKCPQAERHLKYLLGGGVPTEYFTQVQFSMFITGYPEWVFVSYHPHLPPFVVHAIRSPEAMNVFQSALNDFLPKLEDAEARVRAMMEAKARRAQREGAA